MSIQKLSIIIAETLVDETTDVQVEDACADGSPSTGQSPEKASHEAREQPSTNAYPDTGEVAITESAAQRYTRSRLRL